MFEALFPNNNYGKQTTIGTIEHLKNPSLKAIRKYYYDYYVPNNMGVILSGDFNPDVMIKKVAQHFNYMKPTSCAAIQICARSAYRRAYTTRCLRAKPREFDHCLPFPGGKHARCPFA
jgi:Zn-dependent M16 (insulinase) family peptidase